MANNTAIEWCDSTFNPWIGCTRVSNAASGGGGCDNCYAAVSTPARTLGVAWGPGQPRRHTSDANWKLPEQWQRQAAAFQAQHGRRRRVFCASLADVFDNEVDPGWRSNLLRLILDTPDLDWLLLTKRIGNVKPMLAEIAGDLQLVAHRAWTGTLPANVWLGITVVNQAEVDRDVPKLLWTPAAVRFLSVEPMLGPINLRCIDVDGDHEIHPLTGTTECVDETDEEAPDLPGLDWVICGGESGQKARPMHPDWARSLRDQCASAGVPFLFKQWGEWREFDDSGLPGVRTIVDGDPEWDSQAAQCDAFMAADGEVITDLDEARGDVPYRGMERIGKKAAGRQLDGRMHDAWPEVRHG